MKGPAAHAHTEAVSIAAVVTLAVAGVVALGHPFGLTGSTPLFGLPWWLWLGGVSYGVAYALRRRAWR